MDRTGSRKAPRGLATSPHGGYPIGMEFDQYPDGRQRYEFDGHPLWSEDYTWDAPMKDLVLCDDESPPRRSKKTPTKPVSNGKKKSLARGGPVLTRLATDLEEEDEEEPEPEPTSEPQIEYAPVERPKEDPQREIPVRSMPCAPCIICRKGRGGVGGP